MTCYHLEKSGGNAKRYGPGVAGLFLAFPAIFPAGATLIEKHEKEKKRAPVSMEPQEGEPQRVSIQQGRPWELWAWSHSQFWFGASYLIPPASPSLPWRDSHGSLSPF